LQRRPRANGKMSHGGVAIFSRAALANVRRGGPAHLDRGQFIACSVGSFVVASVYVTLDASRSQFDAFTECFSDLLSSSQGVIVAGDFNTFRGPQDSWRFHEAVSRQEVGTDHFAREWLEGLFTSGWIDAVKYHHKVRPFHTWWHSEGHFGRKQGTRLDYIFVSPTLTSSVLPDSVAIYSEQRRGGHAQLALSIE
jgi:exonuclease III